MALRVVSNATDKGLCLDLFGPELGFHHDSHIFNNSGIDAKLNRIHSNAAGAVLYGDSGYPRVPGLFVSYKGKQIGQYQEIQNALCSVRGEIEHFFSLVTVNFRALSNPLEMKPGQRHVAGFVRCAIFFANCLTCANGGNQASIRFECSPPSLREYLSFLAQKR